MYASENFLIIYPLVTFVSFEFECGRAPIGSGSIRRTINHNRLSSPSRKQRVLA